MVGYDDTGVRCTMLRAGTSRELSFERHDLPADPAARDDLVLRLMGTPDARQIDGLGGAPR
jgi:4-oxalomesaconate tautomerase